MALTNKPSGGGNPTFGNRGAGTSGGAIGVASVTAGNASVVIGGTVANPTVRANLASTIPDIGPNEGVPGVALTEQRGDAIPGQKLVAQWGSGVTSPSSLRYYAVDPDIAASGVGFSDTSLADAGTKAFKTVAELLAALPRYGANRRLLVAFKVKNDKSAYAEAFNLGELDGYNNVLFRGTITDTTAGSVAFANDSAENICCGAITATGMNAAGYNPTGAPTTRTIQCLKVGGAAPGFAAEPALPLGARIRFDSATATAALRNICRTIAKVSGGNTLEVDNLLPAAPAAGDVFYIEMPGVAFTSATIKAGTNAQFQVAGLRTTGALTLRGGVLDTVCLAASFCWAASIGTLVSPLRQQLTRTLLVQPSGSVNVGHTLYVASGQVTVTSPLASLVTMQCPASRVLYQGCANVGHRDSFVAMDVQVCSPSGAFGIVAQAFSTMVGTGPFELAAGIRASRIIGPATNTSALVLASGTIVQNLSIEGTGGALPCMMPDGVGLDFYFGGITGATGNNDVGLDLTRAFGCTIKIDQASVPTVTGANGDIRLAGGQIITWAAAAATGIVDSQGNRLFGTICPVVTTKFSGAIVTSAIAATNSYLADTGAQLVAANLAAQRYPTSQRLALRLRITKLVGAGVLTNNVTATLYKNGVPTTMVVTILAADAQFTKYVDSAHPILFADGDDYDVRLDDVAADALAGILPVSGGVEWTV